MQKLTQRQQEVFSYIRQTAEVRGTSPTIREIGKHFNFSSTGSARQHLRALAGKGYIRLNKLVSRGIEILPHARGIPVLGRVHAGMPHTAYEEVEGYMDIGASFSRAYDVFLLRVRGDSMKDAGILESDMVVVRKQSTARSGDIVVALIGDEATVKRFYQKDRMISLEPANDAYSPICAREACILGKVIGLVRNYETRFL